MITIKQLKLRLWYLFLSKKRKGLINRAIIKNQKERAGERIDCIIEHLNRGDRI